MHCDDTGRQRLQKKLYFSIEETDRSAEKSVSDAENLYRLLMSAYGEPRWWSDDPFTVMFQAVLVQNTSWKNVEKTCRMIGDSLNPEYIGRLSADELEELIRPCGFYKAKARTIQSLVLWFRKYDLCSSTVVKKSLETLRKELLSIRGIGAETADVILVYAFFKPTFIIDAYTRRLLFRLGLDFSDDGSRKAFFESSMPEDALIYGKFHWLILEHCIAVCKKSPECARCPIEPHCIKRIQNNI